MVISGLSFTGRKVYGKEKTGVILLSWLKKGE